MFYSLFDTSGFLPRWQCGTWTDVLGWVHILSDLSIWAAYLAIPVVLLWFSRKRRDLPFPRLFWLFAAFIVLCGATHLMEAILFFDPLYRLSGLFKVMTAVVSGVTVLALISVAPKALAMRTVEQVEQEVIPNLVDP